MNASSVSHTLSNLSTSNIKPASHHTPDKPDNQPKPLPHFAFLHQQRNVTAPGNVVLSAMKHSTGDLQAGRAHSLVGLGVTKASDNSINKSVARNDSLNHTTSIATQTDQNQSEPVSERRVNVSVTSRDQEDLQTRSQRDIFFSVKPPQAATYRYGIVDRFYVSFKNIL